MSRGKSLLTEIRYIECWYVSWQKLFHNLVSWLSPSLASFFSCSSNLVLRSRVPISKILANRSHALGFDIDEINKQRRICPPAHLPTYLPIFLALQSALVVIGNWYKPLCCIPPRWRRRRRRQCPVSFTRNAVILDEVLEFVQSYIVVQGTNL